jgi:DNA-binding LacI/PurR family transcriptional regulator
MITIHDVARRARVGISTVSRAFNNHPDLSPETREKVLAVAKQLGYRPHGKARQLARETSETICFVMSNRDVISPFHSKILLGVERYARSVSHNIVFLKFDYEAGVSPDKLALPRIIWERGSVDGLIVAGTNYPTFIRSLRELEIPFVLLGNNLIGRLAMDDIDTVWFDNQGGARQAAEHLISLGHRKICFVGDLKLPWYRRCHRGYAEAMNGAGLELRVMERVAGETLFEFGSRAARQLTSAGEAPSAVAGDDEIALGMLSGFGRNGVSVPGDISVAGFDDIDEIKYVHPPLTTVRVPKEELGVDLARVLFERLSNPKARPVRHVIPTELIVRESTAPPPDRRTDR